MLVTEILPEVSPRRALDLTLAGTTCGPMTLCFFPMGFCNRWDGVGVLPRIPEVENCMQVTPLPSGLAAGAGHIQHVC